MFARLRWGRRRRRNQHTPRHDREDNTEDERAEVAPCGGTHYSRRSSISGMSPQRRTSGRRSSHSFGFGLAGGANLENAASVLSERRDTVGSLRPSIHSSGRPSPRHGERRASSQRSFRNSLDENCLFLGDNFDTEAQPAQRAMDAESLLASILANNGEAEENEDDTSSVPVYERQMMPEDIMLPFVRRQRLRVNPPPEWRQTVWARPTCTQRKSTVDFYSSESNDDDDDDEDEDDDDDDDEDTEPGEYVDVDVDVDVAVDRPRGELSSQKTSSVYRLKPTAHHQLQTPSVRHDISTPLHQETARLMENRWMNMAMNKTKEDFRRVPDPPAIKKLDFNC